MKLIITFTVFLACTTATAASQCASDAACKGGGSHVRHVVANLMVLRNVCARTHASRKEEYFQAFSILVVKKNGITKEEFVNATDSPFFSVDVKEAELRLEKVKSTELAQRCASLVREASDL